MFKPVAAHLPVRAEDLAERAAPLPDDAIKHVFKVLHGIYGNLFLSRYASGQLEKGDDTGMVNARHIWAHGLRNFDADTIRTALGRTQKAHPEFPPNLWQFVGLCKAVAPREVFTTPALPMGQQLRSQYARRAREINERHRQRAEARKQGTAAEPKPVTLDGLKQAVAAAVGAAGGDEVATLLRLDRELPSAGEPA
jgi:hypothetical protein